MKESLQPDVMRDGKGHALLCGYLSKRGEGFYCSALEQKLEGDLGPLQAQSCPIKGMRSRACEFLKPIHGQD